MDRKTWRKSKNGKLVDQYRQKVYDAEEVLRLYPWLDEKLELAECQAFVDHVTASLWWLLYEIPDGLYTAKRLGGRDGFRQTPASIFGWGGDQGDHPHVRQGRDCPWPRARTVGSTIVPVTDGRGSPSARAGRGKIQLPRWSRRRRIILHEISHLVATERPAHGPQFCRVYLEIVKFFGPRGASGSRLEAAEELELHFKKRKIPVVRRPGPTDQYGREH